jgi:LysM repeat protein
VQSGDSLYRIAQRFPGVTAQRIMEVNGISTAIKPGQELKIPVHEASACAGFRPGRGAGRLGTASVH